MGCALGRGDMWMTIWGWAFAKEAMSGERRNVLRVSELVEARWMAVGIDDSRRTSCP